MSARNDGGQAFPANAYWDARGGMQCPVDAGMTLRDYFAAKAMQTLIGLQNMNSFEVDAYAAYEMADAMLQMRLA